MNSYIILCYDGGIKEVDVVSVQHEDNCMQTVLKLVSEYIGSEEPGELIRHLFDVGAQYGHPTRAWNPSMQAFIHGVEGKSHVIDLRETVKYLLKALEFLYLTAKNNGKILFVCTDQQMADVVSQEATRCMQYYVSKRWVAGTLTNWNTVKHSIENLHKMEKIIGDHTEYMKKKERIMMERRIAKSRSALGGIETMEEIPDVVIISSLVDEHIAVDEIRRLQKLGATIKSVGLADTNSKPHMVNYPIPCNDDSIRVVEFMFKLFANVIVEGLVAGENLSADDMVKQFVPENIVTTTVAAE